MKAKIIPKLNNQESLRLINMVDFTRGCWNFKIITEKGYGQFNFRNDKFPAHRVCYEFFTKEIIPLDMPLDHLCRNPKCVNPSHLEIVTAGTNTLRGESPSAKFKRSTHCVNGHKFDERNTVPRVGKNKVAWRVCRMCKNANQIKFYQTKLKPLRKKGASSVK